MPVDIDQTLRHLTIGTDQVCREAMEQMRRGLYQELKALDQQKSGVRQQIVALEAFISTIPRNPRIPE